MDIQFLVTFLAVAVTLLLAHPVGDYMVQTPHQANNKGLTGCQSAKGRWNAAKHALTYTATLSAAVLSVLALAGFTGSYSTVLAVLMLNGLTHYVIDRRWTLELFARKILRKSEWIDNDKGALPHLDQTAHLALFLPVALVIAAIA